VAERHGDLGRWVRLSAQYDLDPRIMRAGPVAELLYVRALVAAKRADLDGHVHEAHLGLLGRGLDRRTLGRAVEALVREELWEPCEDGWRVPYDRWARWQDTKADRDDQRRRERERKAKYRAARRATEEEW
jgi:hypothetical protein